jgi:uncharacterized repeat protein (TIGR02543 family)
MNAIAVGLRPGWQNLIIDMQYKTHMYSIFLFAFLVMASASLTAQTAINTSFETTDGYSAGSVNNLKNWKITYGNGEVTSLSDYVKTGSQGLRLYTASTALQVDNIPYASGVTGLGGDVYADFWVQMKSLPTSAFGISGYDLTSGSRSFMVEFQTSGKIKIYDGSSGWSTQPAYSAGQWNRISVKIDNGAGTYQVALNGVVYDKVFAFREIKSGATSFDFHSIRFVMSSGTCDAAVDNLYIGTTPLSDVAFAASSTDRTITVTQPSVGSITLSPQKDKYQLNDQVSVSASVPAHYVFSGWTGDLSGTANPAVITVDKNYTIGANVVVDTQNPPAQWTLTVNQPTGATITLSPLQTAFYDGSTVTAQVNVQSGYQFNGWTGGLSGTTNPKTFTVSGNMTIGASVSEIAVTPSKRIVTNVTEFKAAMNAMNPGDTVLVADGTYNIGGLEITRGGSALKPILIKSQNRFGAKITGATTLTLTGQTYVTYEGFDFNVDPVSTIFKMQGCSYVRITRNQFKMSTLTDTQTSKWIIIGDLWDAETCSSHHNRIDHNLFDGKYDQGAWLILDGSHGTVPAVSKYDRIDHNIFRNNTPRIANEKETVRLGVSDLSKLDAYAVVEYNLFEDCDGDPEIVSVKSCSDTVRYNTFRRCVGTVCLRQGNNSVVEGNYFFGEGKTTVYDSETIGCGGVRVYGLNHKIINNYFEGLTGSKWDAACTMTNGDVTNTSTSNSSHFLPENVVFAFNTLINNVSNIEIGFDNNAAYGKAPKNCTIANNIVVAAQNPLVKYYSTTSLAGVSFAGNLMYPTGTSTVGLTGYTDAQIKTADPMLVKASDRAYGSASDMQTPFQVYKLTAGSPAVNASTGSFDYVTVDFELQPAVGVRDIGADEYNADAPVLNGELSEDFAGPSAPETYTYEKSKATGIFNPQISRTTAFPNPFSGSTRIVLPEGMTGNLCLKLFDRSGKLLVCKYMYAGQNERYIYLTTGVKGIVYCSVESAAQKAVVKLLSK